MRNCSCHCYWLEIEERQSHSDISQFKKGLGASSLAWFPLGSCKHCYIISNADNSWTRAPYTPLSKDKAENQLSSQTCRESCSGFWCINGKNRNYLPTANPISFLSEALSYQTDADLYWNTMMSWRGSKFTFLQFNQLNQTKHMKERQTETCQTS